MLAYRQSQRASLAQVLHQVLVGKADELAQLPRVTATDSTLRGAVRPAAAGVAIRARPAQGSRGK